MLPLISHDQNHRSVATTSNNIKRYSSP